MIYCKPMWCSLLFDHCYAESNAELWQLQSSVGNEERRREGMKGAKETVSGNKVNSSWFREAVTVNLFTLHVESFAHLDNTVNSNQDPGISNYRPWVEGRWGWGGMWWSDTCEQQFIHNIYSHCRDFIPECLLYYRDVHSRAQVFASNCPPNHWEQVAH